MTGGRTSVSPHGRLQQGPQSLLEVQHKAGDCLGDVLDGGGALNFRKDLGAGTMPVRQRGCSENPCADTAKTARIPTAIFGERVGSLCPMTYRCRSMEPDVSQRR
jgi:hypothetical protein